MRFLPAALGLLFAGASAFFHYSGYLGLMAKHAWTAATITIGVGIAFTLLSGAVGWFLGRNIQELSDPKQDRSHAAVLASCIIIFTGYTAYSMVTGRARSAQLDEITASSMTLERAQSIIAAGDRDEIRALSYNRSCPPEIMRKLALSEDDSVRANTAGNPATPADVATFLARDPNESVRIYAASHPSRRAPSPER